MAANVTVHQQQQMTSIQNCEVWTMSSVAIMITIHQSNKLLQKSFTKLII